MDDETEKSAPSDDPKPESTGEVTEETHVAEPKNAAVPIDAAESTNATNAAETTNVPVAGGSSDKTEKTEERNAEPIPQFASEEYAILSEQFDNYLRIANAFQTTLKRPRDIEICTNLLRKVQGFNDSKKLIVKRNNNQFFRYCLKVLKWTSDHQPLKLYSSLYKSKDIVEPVTETRTWLEDNKSYMALKYLKDGSHIIYAAVAEDPSAGWKYGGLNILAKRGACPNNKNSR